MSEDTKAGSDMRNGSSRKRERPERVPDAIVVLGVSASVVDHNVCQGDNAGLLEGLQQCLQLFLVAVVAVQVVQLPWEVPLQVCYSLRD